MALARTLTVSLMMAAAVTSNSIGEPLLENTIRESNKCDTTNLGQSNSVFLSECDSDIDGQGFVDEGTLCFMIIEETIEEEVIELHGVTSGLTTRLCLDGDWSFTGGGMENTLHQRIKRGWLRRAVRRIKRAIRRVRFRWRRRCPRSARPAVITTTQPTTKSSRNSGNSGSSSSGGSSRSSIVYRTKTPPKFSTCRPADVEQEYNPASGQTSVVVTWTTPVATDTDSSAAPIVTLEGTPSGSSFEGTVSGKQHTIRYKATDRDGLTAYCYFSFKVKVLNCSSLTWPSNGNVECPNGYTLGSSCTYNCDDGYLISGDALITCENATLPTWSATPTCAKITCSTPATLTNGYAECEDTSYPYSSVCTWNCNDGYRLQGNLYIQCEADGQWTGSDQITCLDDTAPTLTCVTPQTFFADQGLTMTAVTWEIPTVTDTIDIAPTVDQTEGPVIGSTLEIGTTIVKYKASDSEGNESPECTIEIRVEEIKCSHPLDTINDNNMAFNCTGVTYVYGDTCTLTCNHNLPLNGTNIITCEKEGPGDNPTGVWDWGTGHQPICEEIECPALDPPLNGLFADNTINQRPVSTMMCNQKYGIPELKTSITFSGQFFCYDDGTWGPLSYVPDCSEERSPRSLSLPSEIYYYSGDCNSAETQEQIRQNFQTILNSTLAQRCPSGETCYVGEMTIRCGPTSGRKKRDLNESIQRWSKTNDYQIDIHNSRQAEDRNPSKHYLVKRQTDETHLLLIEFPINVLWNRGSLTLNEAYGLYDDIQLLTLKPAVQSLIDNGTLDITDFIRKPDSFQTAEYGALVCGDVEYLDEGDCMLCPAGHYLVDNKCAQCPVGTYMDEVGSVQCKSCPDGFTTKAVGSKSSIDCLEFCSPGFYSPGGLAVCSACPVGTYQNQSQSTNCTQCPMDTTTLSTNSSSISDCQYFDVWFSKTLGEVVTIANISNSMANMAVMFWAKPQGLKTNMTLTVTSRSSEFIRIQLTTDIRVGALSTENEVVESFNTSKWTHIAVNIDSTTSSIYVYVDGVLVHEFNVTTLSTPYIENGSVGVSSIGASGVHFSGFHLRNEKVSLSDIESQSQACHVTSTDDVMSMDVFRTLKTQGITTVNPSICDAIDECTTSPCGSHTCINEIGNFTCICAGRYTGDTCTIPPDYCINNECVSGAVCLSGLTSYTCVCSPGYSGTFCEVAPACPDLVRSYGTLLNCSTDNITGTQTCNPYCKGGLLIPDGIDGFDTYRCGLDTDYEWEPWGKLPTCKDASRPQRYVLQTSIDYTPAITDYDIQHVISAVSSNVVLTDCGQTSTCQMSTEITTASRKRRSTGSTLTLYFEIPLVQTESLQLEQYVTDEIVSSSLQEAIDAIAVLENTAEYINTSSSSIFDVTVNGLTYISDADSVQIFAEATCDTGQVATEGLCVQCPVGTYVVDGVCYFCDVGTYQPSPGQTECITCPTGVTTTTIGSTDISECSEQSATSTSTTVPNEETTQLHNNNKYTEGHTESEPILMYIVIGVGVISFMVSVIAIAIVFYKKHGKKPLRSNSVASFNNFNTRTDQCSRTAFTMPGTRAATTKTAFYRADTKAKPDILTMYDIENTNKARSGESPPPPYYLNDKYQ